jgi:hypothetical protein
MLPAITGLTGVLATASLEAWSSWFQPPAS